MKKILIAGYYGYFNSGDDAILTSICKDIKSLGNNQITILSKNPEATKAEYGVNAIYRFNISLVKKEIDRSDIVIMGGGSLLQDKTSTRSLLYYLFIIWYAKLKGKKCILYANGIGPILKSFNKKLTKLVVNKVDIITLREKLSKNELDRLGINRPKIIVTADPVFNLPLSEKDISHIFEKENIDISKPLVGVLFRNWDKSEDYIKKIGKICDYIYEEYNMNILFIPMNYPSDVYFSEKIIKQMSSEAYIIKNKYDAETIIELIGKTKFILSMRLHALLYAAIKKIPMIGFVYDPKVDYYLKELNMPSAGNVNKINIKSVNKTIDEILTNYIYYQKILEEKVNYLHDKAMLNREILKDFIN